MPSPSISTQFPPRGWLYISSLPVMEQAESTGVQVTPARFRFDIRSMRKVDKGKLFMTLVNATITVGGAFQVVGRVRVLCLT